jgi:hypothetical protein
VGVFASSRPGGRGSSNATSLSGLSIRLDSISTEEQFGHPRL